MGVVPRPCACARASASGWRARDFPPTGPTVFPFITHSKTDRGARNRIVSPSRPSSTRSPRPSEFSTPAAHATHSSRSSFRGNIMRYRYTALLSVSALLVLLANRGEKCFVGGVPISETFDIPQDVDFIKDVPRAIDRDVQELEKLKDPIGGHSESISMVKLQESSYTNDNGKEENVAKMKEQLNKNGEMLAKLQQKVSSKADHNSGGHPDTKVQFTVDIPSKGIHKHASFTEPPRKRDGKYREYDKKSYDSLFPPPVSSYFNVEASPEDMAEYIFFTKDDKSVTQAIEKLIQDGRLDRESALAYLSMINRELYRLDARYSESTIDAGNKDLENPIKYQKNYETPDFNDIDGSLSELKEMQLILGNKFSKRSKELDDEDYNSKRIDQIRKILEAKLRLSDSKYSRLLETLSEPPEQLEYTYAQTMMDEIIYQLAKLMFNQGLFIGGSEAQESLQKFTDFLEAEANRGRISRALEKKILDILIMSLSDTLTEHPELMTAAKESFSKYLDTYPNAAESNNVYQKKSETSKTRSDASTTLNQPETDVEPTLVKRSVKTSGIEDNDNGDATKN